MEKFDLDKALAGHPVVTRNGLKVLELHLFNAGNAKYKLCAVIDGYDGIKAYTLKGEYMENAPQHLDLFMAEESYYGFKKDDICWAINNYGDVVSYIFRKQDKCLMKMLKRGNLFKCKEDAEMRLEYEQAKFRLNAKMRELEGAWEANWDDDKQQKFFFCFDNRLVHCGLETTYNCSKKYTEDWRYSNEETIKWVIENMADDIKTVLGVEQ